VIWVLEISVGGGRAFFGLSSVSVGPVRVDYTEIDFTWISIILVDEVSPTLRFCPSEITGAVRDGSLVPFYSVGVSIIVRMRG
jgi:hypothetical protein